MNILPKHWLRISFLLMTALLFLHARGNPFVLSCKGVMILFFFLR